MALLATTLMPLSAAGPTLTYYGRATVKIVTAERFVIYIDPFAPMDQPEVADLVLVTHGHSDHNKVSAVPRKDGTVVVAPAGAVKDARVVKEADVLTVGPVTITVVPAYNKNHAREESVGYVVSVNGVSLYHAGDTSFIPEMASLAALKVDYALFPADGYWNMGGEEARRCADAVKARHAIAIHSSPKGLYDAALAAKLQGPDVLPLAPGGTLILQKP